jgi:RNA 3'-phosphate cyclase
MKSICNAETRGLSIGSCDLEFIPGDIQPGKYNFDIGTAGSIILVFQACLLSAIRTMKPITIRLTGGTDVNWSPSWDYFTHIFLPSVKNMGITIDTTLIKRGYYPQGGGEAMITLYPVKKMDTLVFDEHPIYTKCTGNIHISNLPDQIGRRIKHTAIKELVKNKIQTSIQIEKSPSKSPGVGITLWTKTGSAVLGSSVLGEKGVSSEQVGMSVAEHIMNEISAGATVDTYAIDQLLPYTALADSKSICYIRNLSSHAQTAIWVIKKFIDVNIEISCDTIPIKLIVTK